MSIVSGQIDPAVDHAVAAGKAAGDELVDRAESGISPIVDEAIDRGKGSASDLLAQGKAAAIGLEDHGAAIVQSLLALLKSHQIVVRIEELPLKPGSKP